MKHEVKSIGEVSGKDFLKDRVKKKGLFVYWILFVVSQSCQKDLLEDKAGTLICRFLAILLWAS